MQINILYCFAWYLYKLMIWYWNCVWLVLIVLSAGYPGRLRCMCRKIMIFRKKYKPPQIYCISISCRQLITLFACHCVGKSVQLCYMKSINKLANSVWGKKLCVHTDECWGYHIPSMYNVLTTQHFLWIVCWNLLQFHYI